MLSDQHQLRMQIKVPSNKSNNSSWISIKGSTPLNNNNKLWLKSLWSSNKARLQISHKLLQGHHLEVKEKKFSNIQIFWEQIKK